MPATTLRAREFMTQHVTCLTPDMDVMEAMKILVDQAISGAPVVDERGSLVGVLTERDCLTTVVQSSYHGSTFGGPVADFMSSEPETIDADTSLLDVAQKLAQTKYRRYPVMQGNRVVGLISRRDVLRALVDFGR